MSNIVKSLLVAIVFMAPIAAEAGNTKKTDHSHESVVKTEKKKKGKKNAKSKDTILVKSTHSRIEIGKASWYGKKFIGRKTASGERLNGITMTAAHKKLPLGTIVKVINTENNQSVVVKINDRGPYVGKRILDLSPAAAKRIGLIDSGVATVSMVVISEPKKMY